MAVIWSGPNSPSHPVGKQLGIDPYKVGEALHQIKQRGGLRPSDLTIIHDDGAVFDKQTDQEIGNLYDEV